MARDLKFAMCHTNKSIKKSQDFRNFDLDSSLQIVPPKERRFFGENFELTSTEEIDYKSLKSGSISDNYPPDISIIKDLRENNLKKTKCKLNSSEIYDTISKNDISYKNDHNYQHHLTVNNAKNMKLLQRNLKNNSIHFVNT